MRDYELEDLHANLHKALSEAVMSRIVVTDDDVSAFQRVHNVVSKLVPENRQLTDEDWKRIGVDIERLKEEK